MAKTEDETALVIDEEEEKWAKHYSSNHQILLVGEGDFSFSLSLGRSFGSASNIVASSLDTFHVLIMKYKEGKSNLENLENLGASLLHGVDATKMKLHTDLRMRKFDRIIYNFPHAGFNGKEDHPDMIRKHQNLVRGFFKNASGMLRANGEVHVNHKTSAPFCLWNLEELAAHASLVLFNCVDFKKEDYPGYNNKRGDYPRCDEPFPLGECSTFKFGFSPTAKKKFMAKTQFGGSQSHQGTSVPFHRKSPASLDFCYPRNNVPDYMLSPPMFSIELQLASLDISNPPRKFPRECDNIMPASLVHYPPRKILGECDIVMPASLDIRYPPRKFPSECDNVMPLMVRNDYSPRYSKYPLERYGRTDDNLGYSFREAPPGVGFDRTDHNLGHSFWKAPDGFGFERTDHNLGHSFRKAPDGVGFDRTDHNLAHSFRKAPPGVGFDRRDHNLDYFFREAPPGVGFERKYHNLRYSFPEVPPGVGFERTDHNLGHSFHETPPGVGFERYMTEGPARTFEGEYHLNELHSVSVLQPRRLQRRNFEGDFSSFFSWSA